MNETTLAHGVVPTLRREMLSLVDRQFLGGAQWAAARSTGAALLWRIKRNTRLPCENG